MAFPMFYLCSSLESVANNKKYDVYSVIRSDPKGIDNYDHDNDSDEIKEKKEILYLIHHASYPDSKVLASIYDVFYLYSRVQTLDDLNISKPGIKLAKLLYQISELNDKEDIILKYIISMSKSQHVNKLIRELERICKEAKRLNLSIDFSEFFDILYSFRTRRFRHKLNDIVEDFYRIKYKEVSNE